MGACYSKSGTGASLSPPEKAPHVKKRNSWRGRRRESRSSTPSKEAEPLRGLLHEDGARTESSPGARSSSLAEPSPSRSSTPDLLERDHSGKQEEGVGAGGKGVEGGLLQARVAPSDSGIESIGTTQDEVQAHDLPLEPSHHSTEEAASSGVDTARVKDFSGHGAGERDSDSDDGEVEEGLNRRLQRLSSGSCHRCGNFRLDDSAITALLADTYCLCGPRRAGVPSVNPQCSTHGLARQHSRLSATQQPGTGDGGGDHTPSQWEVTEDGLVCSSAADVSSEKNNASGMSPHKSQATENDIVATSSIDLNKKNYSGDLQPHKSSLRKGASTEILKKDRNVRVSLRSDDGSLIVSTLANLNKSDFDDVFEDNEETPRKAPLAQCDSLETNLDSFPLPALIHKRRSLLSEILDITDSICRCDVYSNELYCAPNDGEEEEADRCKSVQCVSSTTAPSQQLFPSNQSPAAPSETISKSSPALYTPVKKSNNMSKNVSFAWREDGQSNSISRVSSNLSTPERSNGHGHFQRSSSLGSSDGLLVLSGSETSSDGEEEDGACRETRSAGDQGGQDTASVCRTTTLSCSGIQQLMESTEELSAPMSSARRMLLGGVDSVIIPTEVYRQMEADLSTLKQQLQCLSSLMLEEEDSITHYGTSDAEGSFISSS